MSAAVGFGSFERTASGGELHGAAGRFAITTLYLVGSSQVGKTVIAQGLAQEFRFDHRDLDRLLKQRDPSRELIDVAQDWAIVAPLLEDAERSEEERVIVDIGAGTQDTDRRHQEPRLEEWLRLRTSRVILLAGSPDEIYGRSRAHEGHRARFDELEYGPARQRIYATASTTIDVGEFSLGVAVRRACEAILGLVQHAG